MSSQQEKLQPSTTSGPVEARSWLFVPGDCPDRFDKAAASGADLVVCDLEDAVAAEVKASARASVARWLAQGGLACVRVNATGTALHNDDVAALIGLPGLRAVMVPKAEDPRMLAELGGALGPQTALVALIETALGVHQAYNLAAAPGVVRLAFGSIDFALDVAAQDAQTPMLLARSTLVLASRVANIAPPVDGVTTALDDPSLTEADANAALSLGFGGKLCIHPRQVQAVNAAFTPTAEDVRAAHRVLDSLTDRGVGRLDGQMIDAPVVERARRTLRSVGLGRTAEYARGK